MFKKSRRYARHLAAALAATMAVPSAMPTAVVFADEGSVSNENVQTPSAPEKTQEDKTPAVKEGTIQEEEIANADIESDDVETATSSTPVPKKAVMAAAEKHPLSLVFVDDNVDIQNKEWDGTTIVTNIGTSKFSCTGLIAGKGDIDITNLKVRFADSEIGNNKQIIVTADITGADKDAYEWASDEFVFDSHASITKRSLKVNINSVTPRAYKPGDTTAYVSVSLGNLAPADVSNGQLVTANLKVDVAASYDDEHAGDNKTVTIGDVTMSGAHAENYTVVKNRDTITGSIYKAQRSAPQLTLDHENFLVNGVDDTMEYSLDNAAYVSCGNTPLSVSKPGVYSIRYKETGDYEASAAYKVTVSGGAVDTSDFAVKWADGFTPTKTYDGRKQAQPNLGLTGVMNGDDVKIDQPSMKAEYVTTDVGNGIKVVVTALKLTGRNASKYQPIVDQMIADKSIYTYGTITPRTINLWLDASDKTYDGTNTAKVYVSKWTQPVEGDDVSYEVSGTFNSVDAGTNVPVSYQVSDLSGRDARNYQLGTIKFGEQQDDGTFAERDTLYANIIKANQPAPDKSKFTMNNSVIKGFTTEMEYSDDDGATWIDCKTIGDTITMESGKSYQFRYKEDKNHFAGATLTINFDVQRQITITFDLNGLEVKGEYPTTATVTSSLPYGDIFKEVIPADDDIEFLGWYTDADQSKGTRLNSGMTVNHVKDFTVYAHYQARQNNRKDGKVTLTMADYQYGDKASDPVPTNVTGDYSDYEYLYKMPSQPDSAYSATKPTLPGTYQVKVIAHKTNAFNETFATATFKVTKRRITATFTPQDRVYNGGTAVAGSLKFEGGVAEGDDVKMPDVTASFSDKNVGQNKSIKLTAGALTGAQADRYELAFNQPTASITPYVLNYKDGELTQGDANAFTIKAQEKIYDGTNSVELRTGQTKFENDDITIIARGEYADANAGTNKPITISSITIDPNSKDSGNYRLNFGTVNITGTIKKAANTKLPKVNGVAPSYGKTDGKITGLTSEMEYSVDGKQTWTTCPDGELTGLAGGEFIIRYKETQNYTASGTVSVTLKGATEIVTLSFSSDGEIVGYTSVPKDTSPANAPNITKDHYILKGWYKDEAFQHPFVFGTDVVRTDTTIYAKWEKDPNAPKKDGSITVKAENSVYGDGYRVSATIGEGNYKTSDITYTYKEKSGSTWSSTKPEKPGTYVVKASVPATDEYNAAESTAEFTIAKRNVNVTLTADGKEYDGTNTVKNWNISYDGVISGDQVSLDTGNAKVLFDSKNAGNRTAVMTGAVLTGEDTSCYQLPEQITGNAVIRVRTISADVTPKNKEYDGSRNALVDVNLTGTYYGDNVTADYTASFDTPDPGTNKKVTVTLQLLGKDAENYQLDTTTKTVYANITGEVPIEKYDYRIVIKEGDDVIKVVNGRAAAGYEVDASGEIPDTYTATGNTTFTVQAGSENEFVVTVTKKEVPADKVAFTVKFNSAKLGTVKVFSGEVADQTTISALKEMPAGYTTDEMLSFTIQKGHGNDFVVSVTPIAYNLTVKYVDADSREVFKTETVGYDVENRKAVTISAPDIYTATGETKADWDSALGTLENGTVPAGVTGNHTVEVYFTKNAALVSFDANGGTGTMDPILKGEEDTLITLPKNGFTRVGYAFKGWATKKDGAVVFADGANISDVTAAGAKTLYAVWEINTSTVRFDLNGGASSTGTPEPIIIEGTNPYPQLPTIVSADADRPFIGWFTQASGGVMVHAGDPYDGSTTLYAHYGRRSEGKIEASIKDYVYGNQGETQIRVLSGDYDLSKVSFRYRSRNSSEWTNGMPTVPGEYTVRVTAQETALTLGTYVDVNVTVTKRPVTLLASDTGKVYDGGKSANPTILADGVLEGDEVKVKAQSYYDSEMPGDRILYVVSAYLDGEDANRYELKTATYTFNAQIDKMPGVAVNVKGMNETIYGKKDGKLLQTDETMEYSVAGANEWKTCGKDVTTGLANGSYDVRKKETDVSYAGPITTITIYSTTVLSVTVMEPDGTQNTVGMPYGNKLDKPADPEKSGYRFEGWYKDEGLTQKWDFDKDTITESIKLYPKFVRKSSGSSGGSSGGGGSSSSGGSSIHRTDGNSGGGPGTSHRPQVTYPPFVQGTWSYNTDGSWRFNDLNGRYYANEWGYLFNPYADKGRGQSDTDWFRFDAEGRMLTGWWTDTDGNVYYLNVNGDGTRGRMVTGWNWITGNDGLKRCYFFQEHSDGFRGKLYRSTTTPDGYTVDATGAWTVNGMVVTR